MDFSAYQKQAATTAIYDGKGEYAGLSYVVMGLAGEAGEVCGKASKIWRDRRGVITDEDRAKLEKEYGDVLWFWAQSLTELGFDAGEIAQKNLDKLFSRKERGVLGGSGDNR